MLEKLVISPPPPSVRHPPSPLPPIIPRSHQNVVKQPCEKTRLLADGCNRIAYFQQDNFSEVNSDVRKRAWRQLEYEMIVSNQMDRNVKISFVAEFWAQFVYESLPASWHCRSSFVLDMYATGYMHCKYWRTLTRRSCLRGAKNRRIISRARIGVSRNSVINSNEKIYIYNCW